MQESFLNRFFSGCFALFTLAVSQYTLAQEPAEADVAERFMAMQVAAEVIDIDHDTRALTLKGPEGRVMSLTASEDVKRLQEIQTGDRVTATYVAAIAAELREPTADETAEPWQEVTETGKSGMDNLPAGAEVRVVRAVCTIEGMNRLLGTVTILDSRDNYHTVGDVDPARMPDLRIGQTVVVTFSEALAIGLDKQAADS